MDTFLNHIHASFEDAPFGVCVFDSEKKITYVNKKFCEDVSETREDLIGGLLFERLSRLMLDNTISMHVRELVENRKPFSVIVETFSSPKFRESGIFNVTGYCFEPYCIIISSLIGKGLEQDTRFRNLILDAPDAIVLLKESKISFCNKAFREILGIDDASYVIGKDISSFVKLKDETELTQIVHNGTVAFSTQLVVNTPMGRKVLDGRFHTIEESPGMSLAVLRDVTKKAALEERIIRQNSDLSAINSISETLSSSININDVLGLVLEKVLEIMEIETGMVFLLDEKTNTLKCVQSYGIPDYVMDTLRELRMGEGIAGRVAATGEPIIIENASEDIRVTSVAFRRFGIKSFASIPIKSRTRLIGVMNIGAYGNRIISAEDRQLLLSVGLHIGAVLENIMLFNEIERASEELKDALITIEHRNEDLKRLVYTVSHDLKNPIIAVNGFTERLMKSLKGRITEREGAYLDAIMESGLHMEKFVNGLLSFSAAENHRLENEQVDVAEIIEKVTMELDPQLELKAGKVVVDSEMPVITADRTRLMQIFSNLVSNAIKYSHPDRAPLINIGYRQKSAMHIFYVRDNGMGIPSEHLGNVFDMFFRTYEDFASGTGLGLSIVKKAINVMGGDIWIESEKNTGSVFYISLPDKKTSPSLN